MNKDFNNKTIQEYELVYDAKHDVMITIRLNDGIIIDANKEFTNLLGYTHDEIIGRNFKEINLYINPASHNRLMSKTEEKSPDNFKELIFIRKDGSFFTRLMSSQKVMLSAEHIVNNTPQRKQTEGMANDLKEKVQELVFQTREKEDRAEELAIANRQLTFQNAEKDKRAAELAVANKELLFQSREKADRAAELATANRELAFQNKEKDKRAAELAAANKELLYQSREKADRAAELATANRELAFQNEEKDKRAAELAVANKELLFQTREKADRAAELAIANRELVFQNQEKDKRAAELAMANKELAFQNEEIKYLIFHDKLTGLSNREVYMEELKRLDTGENLPLSVIVGDVNGLKQINDTFGDAAGDALLKKFADIIKKSCRPKDSISRISGDEFVILMPKTAASEAQAIIQQMNDLSLQEKVGSMNVSISFGSETKQNEEDDIQVVLKQASKSMYEHKNAM